jgi:hypothetical protein
VARTTGRRTTRCPLCVNGGEYPHWSVAKISDLAVKLGAEFVELSARRVIVGGPQTVLKESRRRLGIHIGAMVSELTDAFVAAYAVGAPLIVAVDDAIERAELSRGQSIRVFRQLVVWLLDQPAHRSIRLALVENSVIRITRLPEDLLVLLEGRRPPAVRHQLRRGQLLQRRHRAVPVRLRAPARAHLPGAREGFRTVHRGGPRRGPPRSPPGRRQRRVPPGRHRRSQLDRAHRPLSAGRLPRPGVARAAPAAPRDGARHGGRRHIPETRGLGPLRPRPVSEIPRPAGAGRSATPGRRGRRRVPREARG